MIETVTGRFFAKLMLQEAFKDRPVAPDVRTVATWAPAGKGFTFYNILIKINGQYTSKQSS
jgi:hypothetical protein